MPIANVDDVSGFWSDSNQIHHLWTFEHLVESLDNVLQSPAFQLLPDPVRNVETDCLQECNVSLNENDKEYIYDAGDDEVQDENLIFDDDVNLKSEHIGNPEVVVVVHLLVVWKGSIIWELGSSFEECNCFTIPSSIGPTPGWIKSILVSPCKFIMGSRIAKWIIIKRGFTVQTLCKIVKKKFWCFHFWKCQDCWSGQYDDHENWHPRALEVCRWTWSSSSCSLSSLALLHNVAWG